MSPPKQNKKERSFEPSTKFLKIAREANRRVNLSTLALPSPEEHEDGVVNSQVALNESALIDDFE